MKHGHAFVSGEKYGKKLENLSPGDICFMYANKIGVLAVGMVLENWGGVKAKSQLVYAEEQGPEYRIRVKWFLTFPENPINPPTLRQTVGWIAPQTLQKITKTSAAEALLKIACGREEFQPKTL